MKKLFFATALVAGMGMLASCSNDDVVAVNGGAPGIAENGLVPVELGISGPSVSVQKRGIGTVGDIDGEAGNVWNGEMLNLLMMERSVRNFAGDADSIQWGFSQWTYTPDGKTSPDDDVTVTNFANVAVKTPTGVASGALTWETETTPKYYPNSGTHDFFAYHYDGAYWKDYTNTTDPEDKAYVLKDSIVIPDANPSIKYVWFKINGSQDLMAGLAQNMVGEEPDAQTNAGFSAQTARAGVKPNINMQHLLTRFTFTVQGADDSAQDIEVEKITVKSKTTGKMIVAYDLGQGKQAPENLISFELPVDAVSNPDGTTAEEPVALELKDRTGGANTTVGDLTPIVIAGVDEDGDKTGYVFTPQPIGHALMVAPGESEYEMSITLKQEFDVTNPDYGPADDPSDGTDDPVGSTTLTRNIVIPSAVVAPDTPTEDTVAQPGSSYAVNVKVYGMKKIEVDATLQGWKDGGDIEVDTNVQ